MSDTREMPGTEPVNTVKKSRGVLLFFISLLFAVVIPAATLLSVLSYTLLQADFYADLLRDGRLITALVEYQYRSMDKRINEEIEEKVGLESYTLVHDRISSEYEAAKAKHGELNSTSEFNTLEAKRSELKKLTWKQSRDLFKTKKDYEEYRERELDKIDRELNEINSWRRGNKKEIAAALKEMKTAEEKYEDSLEALEDKKKSAMKIIEKHRSSLAASIYEDLDRIQPALAKIMNRTLVDAKIKPVLERLLYFMSTYGLQQELKAVAYTREPGADPVLKIKLPPLSFSLWIDEDVHGVKKRRHLLSEIFVEEIEKFDGLKNKRLMLASFRLADSAIGEYFGNRYLKKYNVIFRDGVVRADSIVLEGPAAVKFEKLMMAATAAAYLPMAAGAMLGIYLMVLFFSGADRRRKSAFAKLVLVIPSAFMILACAALIYLSRTLFSHFPDAVSSITARVFAESFMFSTAVSLAAPAVLLFIMLILLGILVAKIARGKS
jgi:hypothetical protein